MSTHHPGAPTPQSQPPHRAARAPLTAAQVCGIGLFPLLGTALVLTGTSLPDVLALLAGCGAIGAATFAAAGSGRRLLAALVTTAVRVAASTDSGTK